MSVSRLIVISPSKNKDSGEDTSDVLGNGQASFNGKQWEQAIASVEDESDVHAMERLNKEISDEMKEFTEEAQAPVRPPSLLPPGQPFVLTKRCSIV